MKELKCKEIKNFPTVTEADLSNLGIADDDLTFFLWAALKY